ncbi:HD-GYP domain-containing protein [Anaerosolibacter sp.]|jgi:HD-GYP domain-containing protein (c-di-GMP phosphodiesterase class II)|uniref:HD-GYP domain-containing protein n=1 Tax=Anaerosolibacter sp. TaxID=1872527 RepID=UPI0026060AD7|nr:HD domain-containing phosphohydrolase [Anaerosolibacter sp.]
MDEEKSLSLAKGVLQALTAVIHIKDHYTFEHCTEVGRLCAEFSSYIGLDHQRVVQMEMAGHLHDVGKIFIEESILLKPGSLSDMEYKVIKEHSKIGSDLISQVEGLGFLSDIILHHHERWDGRGYPYCLEGEDIPFQSRILSVCDCYHALVSDRPYRKALSRESISDIFRAEKGKQFDPNLVEDFLVFIDR